MSKLNLRRKPRVNYFEPEDPDLDEYVYCDDCGDYVFEYCAIHGPLLVIPDDKVPAVTNFPSYVPRAALTIPHVFLHLAHSRIPGAGLGVFTTLTLPRGVRFGPYRGDHVKEATSDYCWQIYDQNRRPKHFVDASDADRSNWLRYVNCSRHRCEQNLVAYQYQGQLYYRTIKLIPRFTELLVFYGSEFANLLGISLKNYNKSNTDGLVYTFPVPKKPRLEGPLQTSSGENTKIDEIDTETEASEEVTTAAETNDSKKVSKAVEKSEIKKPKKDKKIVINSKSCSTKSQKHKTCTTIEKNNHKKDIVSDTGENNDKTLCNNLIKSPKVDLILENNTNNNRIVTELHSSKLTCDICEYTTNKARELNAHLKAHAATKRFSCELCPYITKYKTRLIGHIVSHSGEKPYSCDVCNMKFTLKHHLLTHKRIHTGEKPYSCDVCNRKFTHKYSLVTHKRIHTGEKPYSCDVCNMKFTQKSSLITHERIHSGNKPYSCDVCNMKFNQNPHLVTHKRIHTGEKPYSCSSCDLKFTTSSNLKSHMKKHK